MANRVFISFKAENRPNVDGLRLLAKNPNYDLEFYDESICAPIDSTNATYIKSRIREEIERAGLVLCLIDADTHTSAWVDWELRTAIELGKPIVAMAIKGLTEAIVPAPIGGKVRFYSWDPASLSSVMESAQTVT